MDFKDRLELYLEGGLINESDVKDVYAILELFKKLYKVELCEENASTFIAHICSAYSRNKTKEVVAGLSEEILNELESLDTYAEGVEVLNQMLKVTQNPLSETEKGYALLHINNLISNLKGTSN